MDSQVNGAAMMSQPVGLLAGQQFAPQGFFGNLLGQVGAPLGSAIGGAFGNQGLGQAIGGAASQLGRFLPFDAGPQLAPQGFFGNLLGQVGAPLGSAIGGAFGNQGLGQAIGGAASQLGRFLPFDAGPQLAPQGCFGNLLVQVGAPLGSAIGGAFGNQGLGQAIGGAASQLGRFLPFDAGPQLAPQGCFGNLLVQVGAPLGSAIGGAFGNQGLGQAIGGAASQLGRFLPFDAGPQLAPQSFFSNLQGRPGIPSNITTLFGPPIGTSEQPRSLVNLLPFDAGPQLAPQGFLGGLLGSALGGLGGGAIGGLFGNRNLGNTIGSTAGGILGGILPFEAGPQFAPFANVPMASMYPGVYGGMYYR